MPALGLPSGVLLSALRALEARRTTRPHRLGGERRRRRGASGAAQPQRRIYFGDIAPAWLRTLAKRWARWRITSVTHSPAAAAGTTSALRSFCRWLASEHALPATPRELTRGLLERHLARVHARELSTGQKRRLLSNLRSFLDDVRMHEWAPGLPGNATYFDGEIPRGSTRRLPRFVDEFVMGQIERADNLARLPDLTTQTAGRDPDRDRAALDRCAPAAV